MRKVELNETGLIECQKKAKNLPEFWQAIAYLTQWGISIDENGQAKENQNSLVRLYFYVDSYCGKESIEITARYFREDSVESWFTMGAIESADGKFSTHS